MSKDSALQTLLQGTAQVFSSAELEKKIQKKKSLRVKLGVDPTAPDLHLGHTVTLNKLRQFQDQGHTVIFIIGDYTAMIGDPSGRSETRPSMGVEEVKKNAKTYLDQVYKILKKNQTEVRWNSEWLKPLFGNESKDPQKTLLGILSRHTIQQLTEREDFSKRLKEGSPVSLLELFYPLMQGYDSVAIKADVELGGTDQLFNLLMGRDMQKDVGEEPQVVMTMPLLEGTDGVKKMSKSYNNYIALNDNPNDIFGKIMSIPDNLMMKYYELLTDEDLAEVKKRHPMEAKKKLGEFIVNRYYNLEDASKARDHFEQVFSQGNVPNEIPEYSVSHSPIKLSALLIESGVASSKNEARRLIQQNAVEVAGKKWKDDQDIEIGKSFIMKVGKRQFRKILPQKTKAQS